MGGGDEHGLELGGARWPPPLQHPGEIAGVLGPSLPLASVKVVTVVGVKKGSQHRADLVDATTGAPVRFTVSPGRPPAARPRR